MILNEALCENFNVPTKLHLVTPAIFGAAGAIIKHEISAPSISTLIANSAGYDDEQWLNLRNDALKNAQHTITQRSKNTSIFFIIFAGFLDGINPCAFATIIFFLSYLQVTKRSPTEIMQIGIAFILGVFLAYFSLGLGMREIVTRITIFQKLSNIIDWLIAGFAFSIAIISIRDGILCLRGRMADMTLQLPSSLKTQIHSVIRKGSRQRRFIIAAFIIGIIISFLELACTGQVYLPTILYVLNTSPDKTLAITMLLVYNVAFIIPLTIIFGFAYSGIRSQTFINFMQKHAAIVKFITAAFFFILFILFVF
jgi:cytochrome c biogenesis protein CcdA